MAGRWMAGAAVLALAGGAAAQTAAELPPLVVEADRLRVAAPTALSLPNATASRLPGTAADIPASVESISQATMQQRGAVSWTDALNGLTGITAAVRPGAAGVVSTRGFTENGVTLLYDGIRVSSSTISARAHDSYLFDRIEVLRGPASVLYGEGAVGGAVNLVRRQPSRAMQPFEVLGAVSTRDGVRLGAGTGGPIGERLSYRLDGVFTRERGQVDGNILRNGGLNGALRWDVTETLSTTFDFDYHRSGVQDAYWGTPLIRGRIAKNLRDVNYNNLPNNRYEDSVLWLRWTTEWRPAPGWRLRNQLWNHQADRDWINTYRFAFTPAGGRCAFRGQSIVNTTGQDQVCRQTWENLGYDHRFTGNRTEASYDGAVAGLRTAAVLGAEVTDTRWDSPRSDVTSLQLVSPTAPPATDFFARGAGRNQNVLARQTQAAVFGEARVEVLPGLRLVGGLRADHVAVDYERQPGNIRYDREWNPVTWRAGVVWNAWAGGTLYASYATAAEPRFALFTLGATDVPFSLTRARQWEAGVKQDFAGGRGEITAAAFHITRTDIPSTDPATGGTRQVGEQRSQGVEVGGSFRPHEALQLTANLAILDSRYEEFRSGAANFAGKRPPNVPNGVANLGVVAQPWRNITIGGFLRHRSAIFAEDANTTRLPSATIGDLFASWRFAPQADLTLRVLNVTDRTWAAWATDSSYVVLGMPRTVTLTARASF